MIPTTFILSSMRILEPRPAYKRKRRKSRMMRIGAGLAAIMILVASFMGWAYLWPLPGVPAETLRLGMQTGALRLPWPAQGQASVGGVAVGVLDSYGSDRPVPMASIAKIMLAVAVLKQKPLTQGAQGPKIKITTADVRIYEDYVSKNGAVIAVKPGESITEYQALQAALLPSANNIADLLAIWAFGSVAKYAVYANALAKDLGLSNTTISDASGFSPKTMSMARDLVLLGEAAVGNPVIAGIVSQKNAAIPIAGTILNTNKLLTVDSVVGIKTGNTDQAGGCFLGAAEYDIGGRKQIIIVAVLGASNVQTAANDARGLLEAGRKYVGKTQVLSKGQTVGYYNLPWGGQVRATATQEISVYGWKTKPPAARVTLKPLNFPSERGTVAGSVSVGSQTVPVTIADALPAPEAKWRVLRFWQPISNLVASRD